MAVQVSACASTGDGTSVDAADVDAGVIDAVPDAPVDAGATAFGDECTRHADCGPGGWCVEAPGGAGVCSRPCDDDCPTGFDCRQVNVPDGPVRLCVPTVASQCASCAAELQCPGGGCLQLDGEGRCAAHCAGPNECPTGYRCAADATGAHAGTYCQPVTGSCTCSPPMNGAQRTCSVQNAVGICFGTQTCDGAAGWSACTAVAAEAETCDGHDNDCDFVIDDGVGGGEPCTNTVAGVGSCPGIRTCDGASGFVCQGPVPAPETCNFIDDNCNGQTDETFTDLGQPCTAGTGGCLRHGSQRCNAAGDGTECSVTAGMPVAEKCNGIDDDCDTLLDETFPGLGAPCSAGVGACARAGTLLCTADGLGTRCSATPGQPAGQESCNYLDDDCNGTVDDGFRNPLTGFYDQPTACGACGIDCTTLYDGPHAVGTCQVTAVAACAMGCDPGFFDLDASTVDGCELELDTGAIYVSGGDALAADDASCGLGPTGTGAGNHPCRTITQGLARAAGAGRARVLVADATYQESVTLVDGKDLLGGYRADTWQRHLAATATVIQGAMSIGANDRTVIAVGIHSPTVFEGFVVRGSLDARPGGNSYAVYVAGSSANLVIRGCAIQAGRGGPGAPGFVGSNGLAGVDGQGRDANPPGYDFVNTIGAGACNVANNRQLANGGQRTCGFDVVDGGNGGGNQCPTSTTLVEQSGRDALNGQPGAGNTGGAEGLGGDAGDDGRLENLGSRCVVPVAPEFGLDGTAGVTGGP
ncbi:MAG TPA: MopE-related protein, partial [Kofleriaceae bacterium]|nr:MopE-related protein [Kofleriaceae bacterium]